MLMGLFPIRYYENTEKVRNREKAKCSNKGKKHFFYIRPISYRRNEDGKESKGR